MDMGRNKEKTKPLINKQESLIPHETNPAIRRASAPDPSGLIACRGCPGSHKETEHPADLRRRPRLWRTGVLRSQGSADAAHRCDRRQRDPVHERVRLGPALFAFAGRSDDGPVPDAFRPREQRHGSVQRTAFGGNDAGGPHEGAGLRHGGRGQMAPRQRAGVPADEARV